MAIGYDESVPDLPPLTVRDMVMSYDWPKWMYAETRGLSAVERMRHVGACLWYASLHPSHKRRTPMDVDAMVAKWKPVIVGLATAHDKDDADRYEAQIDEILTPMLTAPVKQIREFAPKLLAALRDDPSVPFLVWRSYEIWVDQMKKAPDDDIKTLKTDLAKEIVDMVEADVKPQLADAMIRALQWRSPEKLQEVKTVVEKEQAAGRKVRLRGRESCLFLEAGGTEEDPQVCVQV